MSRQELVLWPDSATTSGVASTRGPETVTLPLADTAYFMFLNAIQNLGGPEYVLGPGWTKTPRLIDVGPHQILTDVLQVADPAARLRALTAQLQRGIAPPASPRVWNLVNRALSQPPQEEAQTDDWASGLAEDVADADD
jgi:hypothetical protein